MGVRCKVGERCIRKASAGCPPEGDGRVSMKAGRRMCMKGGSRVSMKGEDRVSMTGGATETSR